MTGEIIEVCQDCGYVIDPEIVTAPWGDRYKITMCLRDECLFERFRPKTWSWEPDPQIDARSYSIAQMYWRTPIVDNPAAAFRITVY